MALVRLIAGMLGQAQDGVGQDCIETRPGEKGAVVYGPYGELPAGRYRVTFEIGLADGTAPLGDAVCASIDVVTGDGIVKIAERYIAFTELAEGKRRFSLVFELQEPRRVEYRVHSTGQVALSVRQDVDLERLAPQDVRRPRRGSRERAWENEREFLDGYLRDISGVILVGANLGQERRYYWLIGVDVLWIEPMREIYERMVDNISCYPRQRAINALLGARTGDEVTFGIANNNCGSSSILPMAEHAEIFPDVFYVEQRKLTTSTLPTMLRENSILIGDYQALTLDVEGSELLILQGAGDLLKRFQYIKCEVADFPARTGTPSVDELDELLMGYGFRQLARRSFAMGPNDRGTFWDIVWKRLEPGEPIHEPGYALPLIMDPAEVIGIEKCE